MSYIASIPDLFNSGTCNRVHKICIQIFDKLQALVDSAQMNIMLIKKFNMPITYAGSKYNLYWYPFCCSDMLLFMHNYS